MIRKSGNRFSLATNAYAFARSSCSNGKLKRDCDWTQSDRTIGPAVQSLFFLRSADLPVVPIFFAREAAGVLDARHSLRPPILENPRTMHHSGATRRGNEKVCFVIARAKQSNDLDYQRRALDRFVASAPRDDGDDNPVIARHRVVAKRRPMQAPAGDPAFQEA